ncbi:MAG: DUF2142 domain-containing protein [Candidatus Promineofilum sp.]|nr:DUF2142 domain-containing protein [Promineifilum sp.]
MRRTDYALLGLLLVVWLALGALFAVRTPLWQAPDEPAHYNYVSQLVAGRWPVIEPSDWDQAYLSEIVSAEFDPAFPTGRLTYEDWQPPLYYLLQAPVYGLTGGSLVAMRLLSVVLGAGVVALAYFIGRALFASPWAALAVAVFVALTPQHLAILASVNNDSLAELIIAAILALLVIPWPDRPPRKRLLNLGLLLGLAFLTKGTAYLMSVVAGVFLLARYWPGASGDRDRRVDSGMDRWRPVLSALMITFIPALALGLLWWGRNVAVYGPWDLFGKAAHDAAVVGQPRTAEWIAQYGLAGTVGRFLRTTFISFWGQFGWMAAPLPGRVVGLLAVVTLVAAVGLLLAFRDARRQTPGDGSLATRHSSLVTRHSLHILVLGLTFLLTLALHVYYNLTFVQHQGRYLFPALIPIAVGFTAGLSYWLRPLVRRWPRSGYLLPLGLALLLGGVSLYALWRILPGLAPN